MAIITKIRERAGIAVTIVAVSLGLFVVGSDLLTPGQGPYGQNQIVGEIDGENITLKEYQDVVQQLENEFLIQQGKSPAEQDMQGIREQAWNQIIFKRAFAPEAEEAGIQVSDEEKVDMVQGKNIHPAIKSTFVNQATKEFDKNMVINFLKNIDKAQPQQKAAWYNFEAKLPEDRLRTKYEALLTKTNYVTTAEARREYESQTAKADFEAVFVPYTAIPDSTISVTDDEMKEYLKANQYKYKSQDTRGIDYVQFRIEPGKEDSAAFRTELAQIRNEFATTENDTVFAKSRSDVPEIYKSMNISELPADLSANLDSLSKGRVYGPFLAGNTFTLYKLIDKVNEGESFAKASHILFKPNSPDDTAKAGAKKRAQAVLARIRKGESFEDMARQFGTDGTASNGGDLGWFRENQMVKPFEKAVFDFPTRGLLPDVVETDFGFHIIKVTETKTNLKYKVATIARNITAGDQTSSAIYREANAFFSSIKTQAEFDTAVKRNPKLNKLSVQTLLKSSTYVNDIQDGRVLVSWAFSDDTKIGDIKLQDFNDRYVVAIKTRETNEGPATFEDVKEMLRTETLKQKKAAQILARLKGKTIKEKTTAFGNGALSTPVSGITLSASSLSDFGFDPYVVGIGMGLSKNKLSMPIIGDNGVGYIMMTNYAPAPETKDYSSYKTQIEQKNQGRGQYYITEALKEIFKIKDNRVKFL